MLNKDSLGLITYFMKSYPRRSILMVGCLLFAGLLEGVSIATLIPLLSVLSAAESGNSRLVAVLTGFLRICSLEPTLGVLLAVIVLSMTLKAACTWLAMRQVGYTVSHVAAALRMSLISALLKARWSYFTSQPAGRFAHAITIEAFRASSAYYEASIAIACLLQIAVYILAAILIAWRVAILAIVFGVGMMFALKGLIKVTRRASFKINELGKSLVVRLTDALQGIKPIKAMARENEFLPLLEAETQGINKTQQSVVIANETLKALQELLMISVLAIGVYVATTFGNTPLPSLMLLAFLFYRLAGRSNLLQQSYQKIVTYEAGFWSLRNGIMLAESEREETSGVASPPPLIDGITFDSVHFGHDKNKPILKGVSFVIPAGTFVAIEGPSGAGKTTVADMIIGLMKPDSGVVCVDGVPLKNINVHEWRQMIGYVPQEMFLFHETVLRNITLGEKTISRAAVEKALRAAGAWDFVSQLPNGMDSTLGERGSKVSGGERQRIAIARALVRNPRLLILDEVTTALDPKTEAGICRTLKDLRNEVTIVAVSHQRAVTEAADLVYRLKDGTIERV